MRTEEQRARHREEQRRYRQRNRDKVKAYEQARGATDKRKAEKRAWSERNAERESFRKFVWNEENRERKAATLKAWKAANPEHARNRSNWRDANRTERNRRQARRRHLAGVKDKRALEQRIVAHANAALTQISSPDLRTELRSMLIEAVYSGRFPIRLQPDHARELMREHFREFSKFTTVSLDDVIGADGFTRGQQLGIY